MHDSKETPLNSVDRMVMLIDHDNFHPSGVTPTQLVSTWATNVLPTLDVNTGIISVQLRAYGGWFRERSASNSRFSAIQFYNDSCPAILRIQNRYIRISFEFADSLASSQDCGLNVTHTFVTRKAPLRVKPRISPQSCTHPDCKLHDVRRWLRGRKACWNKDCPHSFENMFEREEQKQVDVHIAVDLLHYSYQAVIPTHIAVVCDDTDVLPALAAAAIQKNHAGSISHLRIAMKGSYLDDVFCSHGLRILQIQPGKD
jgi:uncharacterized LabA/DUF88 family protein